MKNKLICLIFALFLVACASSSEGKEQPIDTSLTIEAVPMMEELKTWDANDIYRLKKQLEQIPLADCEEFFTKEVINFLDKHEAVKLKKLTIIQDTLSLIQGQNKKSLFNLCFTIDIEIDMSNKSFDNNVEERAEQILDFLETFSYYKLKTKEGVVNVLSTEGAKLHDISRSFLIMDEQMFLEQPDKEYKVQTLAYEYFSENTEFVLGKFGIIEENSELYIEYFVSDDYFESNNTESDILSLENLGKEIKEHLIISPLTKEYIKENNIEKITVAFYNGILGEERLKISFEV